MLLISVRVRYVLALVVICAALLPGTLPPSTMAAVQTPVAPAAEGDVPMYLVDAARSGSMHGPGLSGRPQLNWRFESAAPLHVTPAIVENRAYLGDGILGGGGLRAVDTASGREQWVAELPGQPFGSSAAVVDGMAYIGDLGGFVTAVDITTGEVAWSTELGGEITSSPAVIDGTVYIRNGEDVQFALNAATGEERWRFATGGDGGYTLDTAPAVADGVVYMTTIDSDGDDSLFALDAATGEERWRFAPDVPGLFTPVVVDGTVYAAGNGGLYAVDADTGEQRWKSPVGEGFSAPAVADGMVIVHTRRDLVAVDTATGDEQWRYNSGGSWSAPVVVGGMVYVGSSGMGRSGLHVVALDSGDVVWHVRSIGSVDSSPVVTGGAVYIASSEGLFAFGSSGNAVATGDDPIVSMMVGQLVFAVGVDESGAPIEPGTNLPSGVTGIEVLFDFAGIPEGATYRIDWFLNGELLLEGATTPWTIGAMGNANDGISADAGALPDGTYEAVVSFNDQELRRGTVTVGGG